MQKFWECLHFTGVGGGGERDANERRRGDREVGHFQNVSTVLTKYMHTPIYIYTDIQIQGQISKCLYLAV